MKVDVEDLATANEISAALGVSKAVVCNWAARHPDFPRHVAVLAGARVYLLSQVRLWHQGRRAGR